MDGETEEERLKLVANERAKLTATFLNGVAIAMVAVGGVAPIASAVFGDTPLAGGDFAIIFATFVLAFVMHSFARRLSGVLKP